MISFEFHQTVSKIMYVRNTFFLNRDLRMLSNERKTISKIL